MSEHIDRDDLQDFVYGFLPEQSESSVREHLTSCGACRDQQTLIEGEQEAVVRALKTPEIPEKDMDRIVTDMLDSPSGGLVGPRGLDKKKNVRDPLSTAIYKAVPIGVMCGMLAFILFMLGWEQWIRPNITAQDDKEEVSGGVTYEAIRKLGEEFLAGDNDAKQQLIEIGRPTLRVLIELRSSCPKGQIQNLNTLILEIKFSEARSDADLRIINVLLERSINDILDKTGGHAMQAQPRNMVVEGLGGRFSSLRGENESTLGSLDPALPSSYRTGIIRSDFVRDVFSETDKRHPFHIFIHDLYLARNLEYDVIDGMLIISTPERLFQMPPMAPLSAEQKEDLARRIRDLSSESIENREEARTRLEKFGTHALVSLDRVVRTGEPESAGAARNLIKSIRHRWTSATFTSRSAVDTQKPGKEIVDLLDKKVSAAYSSVPLRLVILSMRSKYKLPISSSKALSGRTVVSFEIKDVPLRGVLTMLTRPYGLDFCERDGKIWIDTRENILDLVKK